MTNAQADAEDAGRIIRLRGGSRVAAGGKRRTGGREKEINQDRSRNLYENKQNDDNLPGKKATFLYNGTTFYAKVHVFCKNRRLSYHSSSTKERIPRFEMYKLERRALARHVPPSRAALRSS
jgi:hypothetical protein